MTDAAAALAALADPTRRAVFERVSAAPGPVGAIAQGLSVSRPAVSQHLKVLRDAGLVRVERQGTASIHRIDPRGIGALRVWLDGFWSAALANLAALEDPEETQE